MAKRTSSLSATGGERPEKRPKNTNSRPIVYDEDDWDAESAITNNVVILKNVSDPTHKVVKKILKTNSDSDSYDEETLPFEVYFVGLIPKCNRIVRPIAHSFNDPVRGWGAAIFEHYPLGDLAQWRAAMIANEDSGMVPEVHIWRLFLQIAQGLAVLQSHIGPNREDRQILLHRDIKPKNILVADNGDAYPSFRLHDFGCSKVWKKSIARQESYSGTFEWQPPENPIINTKAADIWALGACVHFLATGKCPIESRSAYESQILAEGAGHPEAIHKYKTPKRYYAARVPRSVTPINLSPDEQRRSGYGPSFVNDDEVFNPQYSVELNKWMKLCLSTSPARRPTAQRLMIELNQEARRMLRKLGEEKAMTDLDCTFEADD